MRITKKIFNSLTPGITIIYTAPDVHCEGDEFIFDGKSAEVFKVVSRYQPFRYSSDIDCETVVLHIKSEHNVIESILIKWDDEKAQICICAHSPLCKFVLLFSEMLNSEHLTLMNSIKIPNPA